MIVCVLLVSNSFGCCLAAGRSRGLRPRDRPARRDNTLGSWHQQHTQNHVWSLKHGTPLPSYVYITWLYQSLVILLQVIQKHEHVYLPVLSSLDTEMAVTVAILPPSEIKPPDSKDHGANMGPSWGRQDPGGPHVGHINFAVWDLFILHNQYCSWWWPGNIRSQA